MQKAIRSSKPVTDDDNDDDNYMLLCHHSMSLSYSLLCCDYNCDTTTIRLPRIVRTCFHSKRFDASKKMNMSVFHRSRIVVVLQSNRTHIVILITSVVVECIVVSSYRSRVVVEL